MGRLANMIGTIGASLGLTNVVDELAKSACRSSGGCGPMLAPDFKGRGKKARSKPRYANGRKHSRRATARKKRKARK